LSLDNCYNLEGSVDHEVSGLETDKFWKREGLGQESNNRHDFKHALWHLSV